MPRLGTAVRGDARMANSDHIAQLTKGVAAWNAWRDEHTNIGPDLHEADLTEANLQGANLKRGGPQRGNARRGESQESEPQQGEPLQRGSSLGRPRRRGPQPSSPPRCGPWLGEHQLRGGTHPGEPV